MRYRAIRGSDLRVSVLGFGTARLHYVQNSGDIGRLFSEAVERGVNHFDFAPNYGEAESLGGKHLSCFRRDRLILSTKVFHERDIRKAPNLKPKSIVRNAEISLRKLKTDYVDILYFHRFDPNTPLEKSLAAVARLIQQGKVRYWGTSEWPMEGLFAADAFCEHHGFPRPLLEQKHVSLARHESYLRMKACYKSLRMSVIAHSALAGGILGGRYDRSMLKGSFFETHPAARKDYDIRLIRQRAGLLARISAELGLSRAQLALSWVLKIPDVSSVVMGATTLEQLRENLSRDLTRLPSAIHEKLSRAYS